MDDNSKQIHDRQEKVKTHFAQESHLYDYLFQTMDNFYYRYLETSNDHDLKTTQLSQNTWGATSFEISMVEALKNKNPQVHEGIKDLAKSVPKAQGPKVRYGLWCEVKELTTDKGNLSIVSEVNWDFPDYSNKERLLQKQVSFKYQDLDEFRKKLALKLEEACALFI